MGRNNQQRRRAKAKARKAPAGAGVASRGVSGAASGAEQASAFRAAARASTSPDDADEAGRLVREALLASERGHPDSAAHLVDFAGTTRRQFLVSRHLRDVLRVQLDAAWRGGWQPADLMRLAGRRIDSVGVALLGDAIVEDLERYAVGTVDPRWTGQLSEAEASRWWGQDTDWLTARAAARADGWGATCTAALAVSDFCAGLPALEAIGPRPGEATPRREASSKPVAVDERTLSRVRQLLAKAESTTFDAEAETFTAGAQALMARHSIDAAMLQASSPQSDAPNARRIGVDRPYESPKAMLLNAVAGANRCRVVWSQELGFATVLGFAPDLEAVETLFTSLLVQATSAVTREGSRHTGAGRSRTRSFRSSFLTSYAARIGERLREVTDAETEAAAARDEADAQSAGSAQVGGPSSTRRSETALVRVLADRSSAVDDAVETMFPRVVHRSMSLPQDREGWISGRAAADRASLDLRTKVSSAPDSRVG